MTDTAVGGLIWSFLGLLAAMTLFATVMAIALCVIGRRVQLLLREVSHLRRFLIGPLTDTEPELSVGELERRERLNHHLDGANHDA